MVVGRVNKIIHVKHLETGPLVRTKFSAARGFNKAMGSMLIDG